MYKHDWNTTINQLSCIIIDYISSLSLPPNPAIVFDIDDTIITSEGTLIYPIYKIYQYIISKGITPVLITFRPGTKYVIKYTMNQLDFINIKSPLIYFNNPMKNDPYKFKQDARKNVIDNGYNIIVSIGDMPWDIGKYGGQGFIVPKKY